MAATSEDGGGGGFSAPREAHQSPGAGAREGGRWREWGSRHRAKELPDRNGRARPDARMLSLEMDQAVRAPLRAAVLCARVRSRPP